MKKKNCNAWKVIECCHINGDQIILLHKPSLGYILRTYHGNLVAESLLAKDKADAIQAYQAAAHAAVERLNPSE